MTREEIKKDFEEVYEGLCPNYMAQDFFGLELRSDGIYSKIATQMMWVGYLAGRREANANN